MASIRNSVRKLSLSGKKGRHSKDGDAGAAPEEEGREKIGVQGRKSSAKSLKVHSPTCKKHEDFLASTFGPELQESVLVNDFSCYYDSSTLVPAHMFCTDKYLCFQTLGHGAAKQESAEPELRVRMPWEAICDINKRNTARLVPNAIEIETSVAISPNGEDLTENRQSRKFFFAFLNRHTCYKALHRAWKGYDHKKGCTHHHDHEHPNSAVIGAQDEKNRAVDRTPSGMFTGESSGYIAAATSSDPETPASARRVVREKPATDVNTDVDEPVLSVISDRKLRDDFDVMDQIGKGAFSEVFLVRNKTTKEECAAKFIEKSRVQEDKREMLDREVDILKRIQHKNIISVRFIYETDDMLYLVMELAMGGELFEEIVKRGKYSERDAAAIIKQVAAAIHYLHTKGIVHRDLKPENLLLAKPQDPEDESVPVVKVADFGLSKIMDAQGVMQTACGTPAYVAPEVLMGEGYDQRVDVWSLGVIAYILLCGFPPFYSTEGNNNELFEKIMMGDYKFLRPYWDPISDSAKDLIRNILIVDPEERLTTEEVMAHDFVSNAEMASLTDISGALQALAKTSQDQLMDGTFASAGVNRLANAARLYQSADH